MLCTLIAAIDLTQITFLSGSVWALHVPYAEIIIEVNENEASCDVACVGENKDVRTVVVVTRCGEGSAGGSGGG